VAVLQLQVLRDSLQSAVDQGEALQRGMILQEATEELELYQAGG
jgi:hypothetical protein